MEKIIIIGGGFAGISALTRLLRYSKKFEIILIDTQEEASFLPLLPDTIGRGIPSRFLTYPIASLQKKRGFKFVNGTVTAVDLEKKEVTVSSGTLGYDYLIISSGSETNFYGNAAVARHAFILDNVRCAQKIIAACESNVYETYLVGGGGYTGIEVATNLRLYLNKKSQKNRILIVERAASILGPLPEWMKSFVTRNLQQLDIELVCGTTVESIDSNKIVLSSGAAFTHAMLIWAAGVKTADFIQKLKVEKNPQGRIIVDEYLRAADSCFIAGDAAYVKYQDNFLRMAVQFALMQGASAADNIIHTVRRRPLKKFKPVDFGYIIPMAHNQSCGNVFGVNMKGRLPTLLHYLVCIYRSYGWKNKAGIVKSLVAKKKFRQQPALS